MFQTEKTQRKELIFLGTYDLQKLNQEEIHSINIFIIGIDSDIKESLPTKRNPGLDIFTAEFY